MNLTQLKQFIKQLSPEKREKLSNWLQDLITIDQNEQERSASQKRTMIEERKLRRRTYRKEMVRCGKESCRCNNGKLHGPYWYSYWSEQGITKSEYIGKKLPKDVEKKMRHGSSSSAGTSN
jgi:hypothetical protein